MSQDTDESSVRPTVIDLDAEDVISEERKTPPPGDTSEQRNLWPVYGAIAALLIGLVAGAWLYRDLLSNYLPSSGMNDMTARIGTLEQQTRAIADKGAADIAALRQSVEESGQGTAAAQIKLSDIGSRLATLEQGAATLADDLKRIEARPLPSPSPNASAAGSGDLAALTQRVAALEKELSGLKAAAAPTSQSAQAAALSQSLADLKAKVVAGVSYTSELDRLQRLTPAAPGLDRLSAFAQDGVPTAQALGDDMMKLASSLPRPTAETAAEPGYLDGLWSAISGVITIRRIGGTDWTEIAPRIAAAAQAGDLPRAIALIDEAKGEQPIGVTQWRQQAAGRLDVDAGLDQVSAAVLRQLSAISAAP